MGEKGVSWKRKKKGGSRKKRFSLDTLAAILTHHSQGVDGHAGGWEGRKKKRRERLDGKKGRRKIKQRLDRRTLSSLSAPCFPARRGGEGGEKKKEGKGGRFQKETMESHLLALSTP